MAKMLLLEDTWQFRPDREKIRIVEAKAGILKAHIIPGVLSKCDEINGNNRRYPRSVWEANLKETSKLQTLIARRAAFGLLEHPQDGTIDLRSPISHAVTKVELAEDGTVRGEITILDGEGFPDGKKLRGLIEFGYDPLVSSRGYGSVVKTTEGIDEVQTDYVCEGWDVVMTPSFGSAQLSPMRESAVQATSRPAGTTAVVENREPADAGQPSPKPTVKVMELNDIRTATSGLKTVNILTASPRVIAESYTQATTLHRKLSEHQAANPGAAWDCTQLHEELNAIEKSWTESIQAIREENTRLQSDHAKLVVIAENMVKTARLYRSQLVDSVQKRNATAKLYEAVCQRGRGWQAIAVKRGAKVGQLEHQIQVACKGLDLLAEQLVATENGDLRNTPISKALDESAVMYHTDTTKLARRIAELKHPVESAKTEIKERLDKCKTAEEVLTIINEMDKAAGTKPEAVQESKPATTAPAPAAAPAAAAQPAKEGKPLNESAAASAPTSPAAEAAASTAAPVQEGITAIPHEMLGHQLSYEQAVGMVRRMSPTGQTTK